MRKKRIIKGLLAVLVAIAAAMIISAIICAYAIKTTEYEVPMAGLDGNARIVCISDLHSKKYGKNNERLIARVAEQNPDAIFVQGDMINADANENELNQFLNLMMELNRIAQVYFSPGNQEMDYMLDTDADLLEYISETGAVTLLDEYVETEIGGNTVRIGGSMGHYYRWTKEQWAAAPDYAMEEEIGSTDVPALVLMHMPETLFKDAPIWWTGDLYICGHTHGGVIRIPGIGGLYAPTQAFWPEYDKGCYTAYGLDFIINAGLSGYKGVPRIFNMPEICVLRLIGE